MNELQRMQYLDALGIEQFVARRKLANTAEFRLCALPSENFDFQARGSDSLDMKVASLQPQRALPKAATGVHQLVDVSQRVLTSLQGEKQAQPKASTQNRSTTSVNNDAESMGSAVRPESDSANFNLAIWHIGTVVVIDSHEPRSALPVESLLANILVASRLLEINLPRASYLHWPVHNQLKNHSWSAAREYVHAYIEGKQQTQPSKIFLLMGEAALKGVVSTIEAVEIGRVFKIPQFSARALYFPSLVSLLREPQLKAKVWEGLCKL